MMFWSEPDGARSRRANIESSPILTALQSHLRARLDRLIRTDIHVAPQKPMLTPRGGTCPVDGARLSFDPFSPHRHVCPACEEAVEGETHDRAWLWRYHLWLSERAVHGALLHVLAGDEAGRKLARDILGEYVRVYPQVPNRDNVLGPTRLFFSTYLEAIWLLQIMTAALLLRDPEVDGLRDVARESAGLIRSFDEGWSNRQVWNNVAMVGAGLWLGSEELVAVGADGPHGLRSQLGRAVTREGMWFEGENYHFFALRGFLLGAELLRPVGLDLYATAPYGETLASMYRAPLATLYPDLTLPARGDAPFGVSVRQPRFAELWEVGRARTGDATLDGILRVLYAPDLPECPDEGESEIAEQERNQPGGRVLRERLGWKALAWMHPAPPSSTAEWSESSRLLSDAGVVILREKDRVVMIESGGVHGGHGHPDLTHMSLFDHGLRFADPGTGSYVLPSLHWYRSTLAHNAPGKVGVGQVERRGWCAAFDRRGSWQWCMVVADDLFGPGTAARRTVILGPHFLIDGVEVEGPDGIEVDLPLHVDSRIAPDEESAIPAHHPGEEKGYAAVRWLGHLPEETRQLGRWTLLPREGERLLVGEAPGPPTLAMADGEPVRFVVRRAVGPGGWWQVYAYRSEAATALFRSGSTLVVSQGNRETRVVLRRHGVRIEEPCGNRVRLRGSRKPPPAAAPKHTWTPSVSMKCIRLSRAPDATEWRDLVSESAIQRLGEPNFRRAEDDYAACGAPIADVATFVVGATLGFAARVHTDHFRPWDPPGPRSPDNEPSEILVDGVQCYVDDGMWRGVVAVPVEDGTVRVRAIGSHELNPPDVGGSWCRSDHGYDIVVVVPVAEAPKLGSTIPVNLVVNLTGPGRSRRRGQLCLGGGGGWVYLRGDREARAQASAAEVV